MSPKSGLAKTPLRPAVGECRRARPRTCGRDLDVTRVRRHARNGDRRRQQRAAGRILTREIIGPEQNQVRIGARADDRHTRQNRARGSGHDVAEPRRRVARRQVLAREYERLVVGGDFHGSAFRYTAPAESNGESQQSIAWVQSRISKSYEHKLVQIVAKRARNRPGAQVWAAHTRRMQGSPHRRSER